MIDSERERGGVGQWEGRGMQDRERAEKKGEERVSGLDWEKFHDEIEAENSIRAHLKN